MKFHLPDASYKLLTPEERFCLLLAAGDRDDEAERDRIVAVSARVHRVVPDYFAHSQAFQELTLQTFMELQNIAGLLFDALHRAEIEGSGRRDTRRLLDTAAAAGYMLQTKAAGWDAFCDRLTVPFRFLWSALPGHDRLEQALKLAEHVAFDAEGFAAWGDRVRPKEVPAESLASFTVQAEADRFEMFFRERVKWWDG